MLVKIMRILQISEKMREFLEVSKPYSNDNTCKLGIYTIRECREISAWLKKPYSGQSKPRNYLFSELSKFLSYLIMHVNYLKLDLLAEKNPMLNMAFENNVDRFKKYSDSNIFLELINLSENLFGEKESSSDNLVRKFQLMQSIEILTLIDLIAKKHDATMSVEKLIMLITEQNYRESR
jgi:NTP pyrophosphatase (non-canonical NTP hydrolase)